MVIYWIVSRTCLHVVRVICQNIILCIIIDDLNDADHVENSY